MVVRVFNHLNTFFSCEFRIPSQNSSGIDHTLSLGPIAVELIKDKPCQHEGKPIDNVEDAATLMRAPKISTTQ